MSLSHSKFHIPWSEEKFFSEVAMAANDPEGPRSHITHSNKKSLLQVKKATQDGVKIMYDALFPKEAIAKFILLSQIYRKAFE